jgi:hypothetical protein
MNGDTSDIREWLRSQGDSVPDRGPLSESAKARYRLAHGGPAVAVVDEDEPGFGDDEPTQYELAEPAGPPPAREVRPRHVATPKAARLPWRRDKPQGKPKAAAKTRKRVPLDDTIATAWRFLGSLAKPLPATSRLLKIQAPVAGKLLEPVVRDTIIDRVLQPFARTTEGAEAVAVLIGPPAVITAMQLNPNLIPLGLPLLRELLMRMVRIAGPAMGEAMKQEREFEQQFGGSVDDLIALLLSDLVVPEGQSEDQAEAEVVRRAQEAMSASVAA